MVIVAEGTFKPKDTDKNTLLSSISIIFFNIVDLPLTTQWLNGRKPVKWLPFYFAS